MFSLLQYISNFKKDQFRWIFYLLVTCMKIFIITSKKKLQEIFIIIWKRMPSWVFLIFSIRYLYFAGLILINRKFKTVKCFNGNNFSIFARQGYIIQLKLELSSTPRFLVCCIASYWKVIGSSVATYWNPGSR